jgi:hypothetical protein
VRKKEKRLMKIEESDTFSLPLPDSDYLIFSKGMILNTTTNRVLTPSKDTQGYLRVRLKVLGVYKTYKLHRVVASLFIPQEDITKKNVNHINGIKSDNNYLNLEWVTNNENMCHAKESRLMQSGTSRSNSKLDDCGVLSVYTILHAGTKSIVEIAKELDVSKAIIQKIGSGFSYRNLYSDVFKDIRGNIAVNRKSNRAKISQRN